MVKSVSAAAEKWTANTAGAGERWKAGAAGATASYCSNFGAFVGHPVSRVCQNYSAGVGRTSAAQFQEAIAGKAGKYAAGLARVQ
jgi:hypothetical protein